MALTYGAEFQGKYPIFEEVQRLPRLADSSLCTHSALSLMHLKF